DVAGNIFATGTTNSQTGIATAGSYQPSLNTSGSTMEDAFIVKFNPSGALQWGTYYGGELGDMGMDINTNSKELLICGTTASTTGIATPDGYQTSYIGVLTGYEAFLSKFTMAGSLKWGTYYGGSRDGYCNGCTIDRIGNLVTVGYTQDDSGFSTPGAFKETGDGGAPDIDGFIVKFCDVTPPVLGIGKKTICAGTADTISLNSGYSHIYWYDDTIPLPWLTDSSKFIIPDTLSPGRHAISVEVVNPSECTAHDTVSFIISSGLALHAVQDTFICSGSSIKIGSLASGGIPPYTYKWLSVLGLSSTTVPTPIASPKKTTTYTEIVTDSIGCQFIDTIIVRVIPLPVPLVSGLTSVCPGTDAEYIITGAPGNTYRWTLSGGGTLTQGSSSDSVSVLWTTIGKWKLTIHGTNDHGCSADTTITIDVNSTLTPVITPGGSVNLCDGDSLVLHAAKGYASYQWSDGSSSDSIIIKQGSTVTLFVTDKNGCSGTSATVTVTVVPLPVITITADAPTHICPGSVVHLTATGATGEHLWSTGETAPSITVSTPGTYWVQVTNAAGCIGISQPITITLDSSAHPVITGPISICQGQGPVNYSIPADAGSVYLWSVTNGSISSGQGTNGVTVQWNDAAIGTGSVMVIETTSGGCLDTGMLLITIDANLHPTITASGALTFCAGDSATLDAGSGYASYQWSKDGSVISGATNEFLRTGESGSYSVLVTNSGGCSGSSSTISVTVYPLPSKPIITQVNDTLFCTTIASSYQWYLDGVLLPGETTARITIQKKGTYSITISDANGCSISSDPFSSGVKPTAIVAVGAIPLADPGKTIEVPIELIASQDLIPANANHYIGTLRYNGSMLYPTGSRNGTLGATAPITGSSFRTLSFEGNSAPMTSGTLQWVQFNVALGNDTCTQIFIDTFYWTDADVAVTRVNGDFCESGICIAGGGIRLIDASGTFGMSPIRPNPSSSHILIEYDLVETGETRIELFDLVGRSIKTISDCGQTPGHYTIDVPLTEIGSGFYLTVLKTPSQLTRQPFVVHK
ncbi:MAG: hypothetical protein Q8916_13905, partial [Bacteroidota bacterium]|nr:hypothetical protein [Bacteroidota bacterium]